MKKIRLSNCEDWALVDDEDFNQYGSLLWHKSDRGYAVRRDSIGGKKKTIYLHRLVNKTPDNLFTDHINRNRLDNRRDNLRTTTWGENRNNISGHKDSRVGERNIDFMKRGCRFRVRIQRNKKLVFEKYFGDLTQAQKGRDNFLLSYGI